MSFCLIVSISSRLLLKIARCRQKNVNTFRTSSQDGDVGFASPHNQKKDNKFKNKNNQNCQKIELYGSPTTKELKKKHSSRLVGGAEMGSWGGEDAWQGGGWLTGGWRMGQARWLLGDQMDPNSCTDKPGGTIGEQERLHNPGFQQREIKHQNLWL